MLRLFLLAPLLTVAANAAVITAVTTEFPPFQSEQPRPWGLALETARELARREGDRLDVLFLPWPRAVQLAETTPDVMIFCLARTPEREHRYGWIGAIAANDVSLWKLRSRTDIRLGQLDDAKRWQLGVTAQDMKTTYLQQHGFADNRELQISSDDLTNLRKLFAGRIDLLPFSNRIVLHYRARELGLDPGALQRALPLPELSGQLFLAFSPSSQPARVAAYQARFRQLQTQGYLEATRRRLGLPAEERD